jgi:hypothetical protein
MLARWIVPKLWYALLLPSIASASGALGLFADFKAASGGARWDRATTLVADGTLSVGGLSGTLQTAESLQAGHRVTRYDLGVVKGAEGFDGEHGWTLDPGGEVAVQDTPEAKQRNASDAWLTRRGYYRADALGATLGPVESVQADGQRYAAVVVTPPGGVAMTLWFDRDSHLMVRSIMRSGQDTVVTHYEDWREVDGAKLPFRTISDRGDARSRATVQLQNAKIDAPIERDAFAVPTMSRDSARIAGGSTRLPFDLVNNHIYVDGVIDGKPVRLLVDTGGLNIVLPAAAAKLGLASQGKLVARGVGEQQVDLALAQARELKLGALSVDAPTFYVIDLGPFAEVEGVPVDGIVGYEVFRRFGVRIDYAAGELTLSEPAAFAPPAGATELPFTLSDRIPIIEGKVDGKPVRLTVDTGSRASLSFHSPYAKQHDLVRRLDAAPEAVGGWGVGGPSYTRAARLSKLELGNLAIENVAADIFTGDKGAFASPDAGANLGGGTLRRFTVSFDYERKRMYLEPNARYEQAEPFDRSGLWLMTDGNMLKVAAVAPQSAAARAGIKPDSRIAKIAGEAAAARTLAAWRDYLRTTPAGTKVAVTWADGRETTLTLADRIAPTAH